MDAVICASSASGDFGTAGSQSEFLKTFSELARILKQSFRTIERAPKMVSLCMLGMILVQHLFA